MEFMGAAIFREALSASDIVTAGLELLGEAIAEGRLTVVVKLTIVDRIT